jgi:hypothetical protein
MTASIKIVRYHIFLFDFIGSLQKKQSSYVT